MPVLPVTSPMQVKNFISAPPMLPVLNRSTPRSRTAAEMPRPRAAPAAGSHQLSWYSTKAAAETASIMLNSFPKFQTRDLPGLKIYLERKGELPKGLVFGLAAIITYYKGGKRDDGVEIVPNDDPKIMDLLKELWATGDTQKVTDGVLGAEFIWQENLNKIPGLNDMVKQDLDLINSVGMLEAVKSII